LTPSCGSHPSPSSVSPLAPPSPAPLAATPAPSAMAGGDKSSKSQNPNLDPQGAAATINTNLPPSAAAAPLPAPLSPPTLLSPPLPPPPPSLTPESDSLTREESDRGKGGGHRAEEFMFSFPLLINPTTLCKDFLSNKQHVTKTLRELNYAPEIFSALELGCGPVVTPPREVAAGGGSTPASSTRPRSGLQ
jgi:hypothetical protein